MRKFPFGILIDGKFKAMINGKTIAATGLANILKRCLRTTARL